MVIYPFHSLWSMKSDRFVLLLWEGMVFQQCRKNFKKGKAPLIWCSNDGTTNVRLPRLFGFWLPPPGLERWWLGSMVLIRFNPHYFRVTVTDEAIADLAVISFLELCHSHWCNTHHICCPDQMSGRMLSPCSVANHWSLFPSLPTSFARCIISCITAAWQQKGQKAPGTGPIKIEGVTMPFSRVVQPPTIPSSGTSWARLFWFECVQLF